MSVYSAVQSHLAMNFDTVRNSAYATAIQAAVNEDSVVLDLGAGLGLLGMLAAQAGARKVYLVEPEPVIEVARKIADKNSLGNVECIQATAEELHLPEKADLIISVMTGNFLLTEDLLPSLFRARDRFLAPSGRLIPDSARMWTAPVTCSNYYLENIDKWAARGIKHAAVGSGLDYSPARLFAANSLYYDTAEKFDARELAPPSCLCELDFMTAQKAGCDAAIEVEVTESATLHGWLGWFDMRLGAQWLSTAPDAEPTHWRPVFMPLEEPLEVEAGQRLSLRLKRPERGEWTWITEFNGRRQRQSTFLSLPRTPTSLLQKSEKFHPRLSEKGEAARVALTRMNGSISSGDLADLLFREYSQVFAKRDDAVRLVKALAEKYGEL